MTRVGSVIERSPLSRVLGSIPAYAMWALRWTNSVCVDLPQGSNTFFIPPILVIIYTTFHSIKFSLFFHKVNSHCEGAYFFFFLHFSGIGIKIFIKKSDTIFLFYCKSLFYF